MRVLFFWVLLFSLPLYSDADNEILFDQQSEIDISEQIKIFKPGTAFRDINDVLFIDHLFTENNQRLLNINARDSVIWTKFDIRNVNQYPISILLEYRNANIQEIHFYIKKELLLIHKKQTGAKFPFYQRSIKSRFFVQRFMLEPGIKYTIFTKIINKNNRIKVPVTLYDQQGFNQRTSVDNLQAGLFYGIFFTLLLTALLFFILKFDVRSQFFYMLYMLSFMLLFFLLDGFALQYLFFETPAVTSYVTKVFPFIIIAAFAGLAYQYFKFYNHYNFFRKILYGVLAGDVLIFALALIFNFNVQITMNFVMLVSILLIAGIVLHQRKYKIADASHVYFKWAMLMSFIIVTLFGLQHYLTQYGYNDFQAVIKIAVIIQLSLVALSYYKRLQISHSRAQQNNIRNLEKLNKVTAQHNAELEKKVAERTQTLEYKNAQLEEHMAENKAITEELHRQRDEMENLNKELEKAFKKSTADHVRLQKAMVENEQQQQKLEESFKEISEKNKTLETQNEEIRAQSDKIQEQHHLLEIKNRDITDSIIYAERIQNSILPPLESIRQVFPDSFIYFRPKERLSGDFYWFDSKEQNGETAHMVSAVDCTGHGVPGALMSIIAKDGLNDAVNSKNIADPGKIIHHLNQVTINTLNKQKNADYLKDGMDLSLVKIVPAQKKIYFAGARNPLYLLRDNELYIYDGNVFSAGTLAKESIPVKFETQEIDYKENDMIYLFSDGFADQFGGEKGQKFRYKRFKKMMSLIVNLPIEAQKKRVDEIFLKWKKDWEQIDDVLIVGIRL
ncbi:MAG TPA: 7TM-DISM domain-containing protein [Salinivirga sp.]|uniref:7TM-DISM domain-containing protein n=1 Tax=Salinivirga sp. TaxID=1970192 RepID=UPI002B49F50D|nr:7TM-DISM domain-containing protein [Salinivirga sp.]HKK58767.1 7TM-DISM domain-containing protein [Salinivirga sp.]